MRYPLRFALLLLPAAVAAIGACGPNVILDTAATGTGAGGAGGSTGTAFGGGSTTTSFGQGAEGTAAVTVGTTVGPGGSVSATSTAAVGTGGGFSSSTTVTVGTGGVSVTSATSTGTGVMGACTDGADAIYLDGTLLYPIVVKCAFANLGNASGETMCVESSTSLSPGCVACVVDDILCSVKACTSACAGDPNGAACEACRNQNCAAAFLGCSGTPYAPGSTTCQELLFNGTKGTGWQLKVFEEAFITATGRQSYEDLQKCACLASPNPLCAHVCDAAFSNGPPDFCNGAVASPQCLTCLESSCGGQFMNCQAN